MKLATLLLLFGLATALPAQVTDHRLEQAPAGDWLHYNGSYNSQRHSDLNQINLTNIHSLAAQWVFHIPGSGGLQSVPVVVDGVMYVTQPNEVYALDSRSGRLIWQFHHDLNHAPDREGPNRGVAVFEDKVYFTTTDAFLVALKASTGSLLWQSKIAESKDGYHSSAAPMVAKGTVMVGVIYGDRGLNGFLDAFDAKTGSHLWRFDSVPGPGKPGHETWAGDSWLHGGGATWLTGSYDPEMNTLFWALGNPSPDFNGDVRKGDNLYTDSVVALDLSTGKLKWHFQFTPHDVMDWDGSEIPVLVDTVYEGKPRKLLVQANRNGFYYILDRTNGKFLRGKAFYDKLNWASGLTPEGRPILVPGIEPSLKGTKVCPSSIGATNWMSPTYDPQTKLFSFVSLEGCGMATKNTEQFRPGGFQYRAGGDVLLKDESWKVFVRALDLTTGKEVWKTERIGSTSLGGGLLSTGGGVIYSGEIEGEFVGLNAKTGKPVWHFNTGQPINSQPITYMVKGRQYISITANSDVFSFALPEVVKAVK
ncbi:PQQ-binding-like beta-propeller repeat protein [Granulicella sp. WH15]|uniref:outer membrane protein assembly factor BamB family protein n=1 Tax=Granulicella sp. WH15 TaxID=2602070 RepID=UPI0013671D90|nr:PQQ-binding-like beta-propeller repeat protein [Granulicella sp. WH15]QHN04576.1 PQQ-binding-like beta-propeller repeat protein [Granulicella sp. WH15]